MNKACLLVCVVRVQVVCPGESTLTREGGVKVCNYVNGENKNALEASRLQSSWKSRQFDTQVDIYSVQKQIYRLAIIGSNPIIAGVQEVAHVHKRKGRGPI